LCMLHHSDLLPSSHHVHSPVDMFGGITVISLFIQHYGV